MGFEPKFPVNRGIFKTKKNPLNFQTIKKPVKYTLCRLFKLYSDRGGVRTPNPQSRNLIFYPVELRGRLIYDFRLLIAI